MYYFVATDDIQHPETRESCIAYGQIIPLIDLPGICDDMGIDHVSGVVVMGGLDMAREIAAAL